MMSPLETQKNDAINAQYQRYLAERAQREAEAKAIAEEIAVEKAKIDAFYRLKREQKPQRTVTTRKPHPCHLCQAVISVGEKVVVDALFWRDGNLNPQSEALYFCGTCRPVLEVKCKFFSVCGNSESYYCTHAWKSVECGSHKRRRAQTKEA